MLGSPIDTFCACAKQSCHSTSCCSGWLESEGFLMLNAWLSDLRLYRLLISMQIKGQMQYKVNLLIEILAAFSVTSLEFVALLMFFIPFPTLLGWRMGEVALLTAIISISFGLAELVGAGIDNFPWTIRRGEFDRVLLRPVGAFMQVIGSDFLLRRFGRIT